jgi:hypothetical protein
VPVAIMYTCVGTAVTGLVYLMTLLFATSNRVDELVQAGFSVSDVFGSCAGRDGAFGLTLILLINLFFRYSLLNLR